MDYRVRIINDSDAIIYEDVWEGSSSINDVKIWVENSIKKLSLESSGNYRYTIKRIGSGKVSINKFLINNLLLSTLFGLLLNLAIFKEFSFIKTSWFIFIFFLIFTTMLKVLLNSRKKA